MRNTLGSMLLTTDTIGGVWRYTVDLAAGLLEHGVTPVVVTLGPPPSNEQRNQLAAVELVVTDLPLDWLAGNAGEVARAAARIIEIAAAHDVSTLHLHAPALLSDGPSPCPAITVLHSCHASWWDAMGEGALPPDLAWRFDLTAAGLAAAAKVIVPTRSLAEIVARLYATREIHVVHNGRAAAPVRAERRRDPVVLTSGRLWDHAKNAAMLDRAAGLIEAPVIAAGHTVSPTGESIGFQSMRLLGHVEQHRLDAELARAAVFCSLARYEPFGLGVLEAAQAGCALVLSDIPTFRELWEGAALFTSATDPVAVAKSLREALARPAALGRAAQVRAARYSIAAMVVSTLGVHQDALSMAA